MHPRQLTAFVHELVKQGALSSKLTPGSSNVRGFRYDAEAKSLFVTYKSGGTYRYDGVPASTARALGRNKSVGKTISRLVKPNHSYEKVGSAKEKLMREVLEALRIREMRGPHARTLKVRSLPIEPPPIPRQIARAKGNVLPAVAGEIKKHANGDMLQYYMDHPDRLKAKQERARRKGASKNSTRGHWAKQAVARSLVRRLRRSPVLDLVAEELAQHGLTSVIKEKRDQREHRKHAGVAKKQVTFDGLRMKIEYEPGDIRKGKSKGGKTWERKMHASYGYVPGTKGLAADGDAIDVYLAPEPREGAPVFEIRQEKKEGGYDESKFMVGWPTQDAAKAAYLQHMPEWAFGSIRERTENVRDFAAGIHMAPKVAAPRPPMYKTASVFMTGFVEELAKEAGLRDVIKGIVSGKPKSSRLGFFERRRLAKSLGVKAKQVESVLAQQHRTRRLVRGAAMGGAALLGLRAGSKLLESSDE